MAGKSRLSMAKRQAANQDVVRVPKVRRMSWVVLLAWMTLLMTASVMLFLDAWIVKDAWTHVTEEGALQDDR